MRSAKILAAACLVWCASVSADEIVFKNGDRLSGTITQADGGKLTIKTAVAGDVKVDMKDVKTFSTDQPIELRLNDGSTIKDKVNPSDAGTVRTAGEGAVEAQQVPLTSVKKINPPPVKWDGSLTIGGLVTRGNSHTENINFGLNLIRRSEDDRITFDAAYLFGRQRVPGDGTVTTTDNWFMQPKYDYFFTEKFYMYALTRVEKDRIANLDLRVSPGAGVGYQWVERPDMKFSTEAGLSWVYENYTNAPADDHFAARFAYHFDKQINERVKFFHNLEYLPSIEEISDFNVNADAGIRASLTKTMFTEVKAEWKNDQTPAPGAKFNDFRYLLSVGWTF
jgi:putative salt-induced outer membrane protein YdiY